MKHLRRLALALLTFIVGVVVSPIHFYVEAWGCGKVIDGGGGFSATYYSSSYFVTLVLAHEGHVSPKKANQVFDQRLRQAVQVFELGPKTNREGKVVGQRAFALFFSPVC